MYLDECLVGYLIRVSELNGFKHIGYLLRHAGLAKKNNRAPVHQILTGEFDLTRYFFALGLTGRVSQTLKINGSFQRIIDTPYIFVKYPKVCPECLAETGYCKYYWVYLPVLACGKHKIMLVDVQPNTGERLSWHRKKLDSFDNHSRAIKHADTPVQPAILLFSKYIESLIFDSAISVSTPTILHGLMFRESLTLINFLAHYRARLVGDEFMPVSLENLSLAQHYQNVWNMLSDWPDSLYALLSQYIERPMSSRGIAGINKHYRDFYERLHRQQENKGIARIKADFDHYIEAYWPGLLESDRITRINLSSSTRNIISKKEAAKLLGSRPERINKLVQMEKLSPVVFKGKVYYLRDQIEALANTIATNWSMAEACEALQLKRYQFKQLLDAGVIPVLQRPDNLNRDWIIDKAQCRNLLKNLRRKARKTQSPEGTVSMAGIQRQGFSIIQLISAMQTGKLEYGVCADKIHPDSFKQFVAFKIKEKQ